MSDGLSSHLTVLERWRLGDPLRSRPAGRGTNNQVRLVDLPGRRVVVRVYQNLDATQVAAEHAVLAALGGAGMSFQVPRPLPTPDGATWVDTPDGPAAVFEWLAGERPEPTLDVLERVGRALGELDVALAGLDPELGVRDWLRVGLAETHPAVTDLAGLGERFGAADLLAELPVLDETYARLVAHAPVQLVHEDMAQSNVLVEAGEVAAVLDFELVGLDLRICDPVAALVNDGCLRPGPDPLARAAALLRGYGVHVRLTDDELTALPAMLCFRSAAAAVWRYGRYLRGQADAADVRARLAGLAETIRWTEEHGDDLVAMAGQHCG